MCGMFPGDLEQERYFFSNRESKYRNGNRANRVTSSGNWKATGVDKKIVSSRNNNIVGKKKTLVFYKGKSPNVSKTDWVMHEYCLVNAETTASIHATEVSLERGYVTNSHNSGGYFDMNVCGPSQLVIGSMPDSLHLTVRIPPYL